MPLTNVLLEFPSWLPVASAVFVVAGCVKGVVGLGLPTVAMGLLALRLAPAEAAALLIVPSLVTNLWQMGPWRSLKSLLPRLRGLLAGVCLGTWAGAWWLGMPGGVGGRMLLGVALIGYALWSLAGAAWQVPARHEGWLGPVMGGVTGAITAVTGVFVLPAVPYLQALQLPREHFVQAMGLSFSVSTLALAIGMAGQQGFAPAGLAWSVLMPLPALLGMALGSRLRQRLSPLWFRRCVMVGLLGLGLHMALP